MKNKIYFFLVFVFASCSSGGLEGDWVASSYNIEREVCENDNCKCTTNAWVEDPDYILTINKGSFSVEGNYFANFKSGCNGNVGKSFRGDIQNISRTGSYTIVDNQLIFSNLLFEITSHSSELEFPEPVDENAVYSYSINDDVLTIAHEKVTEDMPHPTVTFTRTTTLVSKWVRD